MIFERVDYRRIQNRNHVRESWDVEVDGEFSFHMTVFTYDNGDKSIIASRNWGILHEFRNWEY